MKVLFPAAITKVQTLADRTLKLTVLTSTEMSASEKSQLFSMVHSEGWALFSQHEDITEADVPDEKPDSMTGTKTQAQRLRSVVWHIWRQKGEPGDFEGFYRSYLERVIEREKTNLEKS